MNLNDRDIKQLGAQLISPFDPSKVQPASYDLSLSPHLLSPNPGYVIDLRVARPADYMTPILMTDHYVLKPNECLLASTNEIIRCPDDIVARVEGKSSLGRLFLAVHVTAGFVDPGWHGQITLEIVNHGPWDIVLWKNMSIAQINFSRMTSPVETPYGSAKLGSHYHGQTGPTAAIGKRNG